MSQDEFIGSILDSDFSKEIKIKLIKICVVRSNDDLADLIHPNDQASKDISMKCIKFCLASGYKAVRTRIADYIVLNNDDEIRTNLINSEDLSHDVWYYICYMMMYSAEDWRRLKYTSWLKQRIEDKTFIHYNHSFYEYICRLGGEPSDYLPAEVWNDITSNLFFRKEKYDKMRFVHKAIGLFDPAFDKEIKSICVDNKQWEDDDDIHPNAKRIKRVNEIDFILSNSIYSTLHGSTFKKCVVTYSDKTISSYP